MFEELENCEQIYDTSLIRRKISNANYIHGIVVSCKSQFIKENFDEPIFMFAFFKCRKSDKGRN